MSDLDNINRIREYINQEIICLTESIKDYIDDDKEGNKQIIDDLKEQREHWKDLERIFEGKSNEELYMNWWRYGLYE
jgi:DNA helicase IV